MGSGKYPPAAFAVFRDLSAKSALVPFVVLGLGHVALRFVFHFVPFLLLFLCCVFFLGFLSTYPNDSHSPGVFCMSATAFSPGFLESPTGAVAGS